MADEDHHLPEEDDPVKAAGRGHPEPARQFVWSGVAWKLCEDFNLDKAEDPNALQEILKILDGSFQYDSNVEMPADFSAYFEQAA